MVAVSGCGSVDFGTFQAERAVQRRRAVVRVGRFMKVAQGRVARAAVSTQAHTHRGFDDSKWFARFAHDDSVRKRFAIGSVNRVRVVVGKRR